MSELLKLENQINHLEKEQRQISMDNLMDNLIIWGGLASRLREIHPKITKEEMINQSIRLSKILTVLITEVGICNEFSPLPEVVSALRHQKRFDICEAESLTALVYCTHKVIECLAITLSQQESKS